MHVPVQIYLAALPFFYVVFVLSEFMLFACVLSLELTACSANNAQSH